MVTKRSEYQRQFRGSTCKKSLPVYYENLIFRSFCRNREQSHTPIEWESSDESEYSSSENVKCPSQKDSSTQTKKCKTRIPSKCDKHKKQKKIYILEESDDDDYDDDYDEDCKEEPEKVNKSTNTDCVLTDAEDGCSSDEDGNGDKEVVVLVRRKKNKGCDHKGKVPTTKIRAMKCTRIKRPDRCQEIQKKSCRKKRPASAPVREKPPFVAYGWAENVKYRTHNVRAPRDIYPTALNAKRKREQFKHDEEERLECHRRQLDALFDRHEALRRRGSPADWQSEYRRCFPAYDVVEYAKVLSARSAAARSRK